MRRLNIPYCLFAALSAMAAAPPPAVAGEAAAPVIAAQGPGMASDPCGFYRGQAYGRGLDHFLTEMLWACEAIAARRGAGMPLGDRLVAAEVALERYRAAVIAAGAAEFALGRSARPGALRLGAADAAKASLAASTGTLTALERIRTGF